MQEILSSERLLIRPIHTCDSEFILELVNTEGWLKYIGDRKIRSGNDSVNYIRNIIHNPEIDYWVVCFKDDDRPIGIVSLVKRKYLPHPDIGFAFLPAFNGYGFAFEATKTVLYKLICDTNYTSILSVTVPGNTPSIKLLDKLGLKFKKIIEVSGEKLQVYEIATDNIHISEITDLFLNVFNNKNGRIPDFEILKSICIPQVLIINMKKQAASIYDLTSFIEPRKRILTDGTLVDFQEYEIYKQIRVMTNIAQRFSVYKKTGILNGKAFEQTGHKLFQFIKIEGSWKINSLIWEDNNDLYVNKS